MNRRLRRGISPLIATVLLILIAISTGLLIYAFATGWIGSRTSLGAGPSSFIAIDATYLNKTDEVCNVTVYVRNVGSVSTNVTAIYVKDLSSGAVYANTTPNEIYGNGKEGNLTIRPGEVKAISANIAGLTLKKGYSYEVKVVTIDGAVATTTVTYRG